MAISKIITDELLPEINAALTQLDTFDTEYELATRAGLGTSQQGMILQEMKAKADKARAQLLAVKNVYFPGQ